MSKSYLSIGEGLRGVSVLAFAQQGKQATTLGLVPLAQTGQPRKCPDQGLGLRGSTLHQALMCSSAQDNQGVLASGGAQASHVGLQCEQGVFESHWTGRALQAEP